MADKKPKFYAVKVGLVPGIYRTWAECEPLVHGVQGAKYKSFPTQEEAQAFLNSGEGMQSSHPAVTPPKKTRADKNAVEESSLEIPEDTLVAFVDGSYDAVSKRYGFGCVLLTSDGREICENGVGDHPQAVVARNVAGELQGTLTALKRAEEMGYKKVVVCHDYSGISAWYHGEWRANSFVSKEYVAATEAYRGVLEVSFRKIAAHTGVKYNEMADRLAKDALGIGE